VTTQADLILCHLCDGHQCRPRWRATAATPAVTARSLSASSPATTSALITGLGDLRDVIHDAELSVKAAIYEQLGLKVT